MTPFGPTQCFVRANPAEEDRIFKETNNEAIIQGLGGDHYRAFHSNGCSPRLFVEHPSWRTRRMASWRAWMASRRTWMGLGTRCVLGLGFPVLLLSVLFVRALSAHLLLLLPGKVLQLSLLLQVLSVRTLPLLLLRILRHFSFENGKLDFEAPIRNEFKGIAPGSIAAGEPVLIG